MATIYKSNYFCNVKILQISYYSRATGEIQVQSEMTIIYDHHKVVVAYDSYKSQLAQEHKPI